MKILRKALVLVEIVAVFFAGTFAARFLLKALGITGSKQAINSATTTHFDAASVAVPMIIRWSIVIGLAFLVGWLVARHRPRDYGLTLAGRSLGWQLRAGVVTAAFGFLPVVTLLLLRHYFHLPGGPAIWAMLEKAPRTLEFWLFMLASSIVIPPIVEEIFFRGYAQTRLATAFRPGTAVLTISLLFVMAHVQYFDGSLISTVMLPFGFWQFTVLGLSRLRTGSLVAPMVAHAIGNIPLRPPEQWALAIGLAVVLVWALASRPSLLQPAAGRDDRSAFPAAP
jgi:membrane protease YdiL (CAAX protease family)